MRLATTLSVLVLGAGGIGHAVMTSLNSGIGRVDAFKDMKNRPDEGHGLNFLLVGTDGRDKITEKERQKYRLGGAPCHCTDTIMLVHLSENGERASVVSVPRDSYAELPEHTDVTTGKHHKPHPVKINAAYAEGGPNLTVRTVEHLTGVKIGHYLEVDFTSFMKTVDALGGVEICTPRPLSDSYTGLDLTPGTHKLDGGQALQYVRSRHVDGTADLSRMERQQRFVAALISRATSSGVLLNPVKLRDIATTMLSSVRADSAFGTEEMLAVNEAMRGFSPSAAEFTSVPVIGNSVAVKGIGATVRWDPVKSKKLFQALREDKPLTPAETSRTPRPDETTETLANQASLRSPRTSLSPPISPSPPISQSPQISQSPRMSQSPQAAESRPGDVPGEPSPGPRGDVALVDVKPQRIRVQVINGTRTDGLGKQVDDALRATGFDTTRAPLTSDGRDARRTVVLYDPRWDRSAKSLAAALPGSELRAVRQQGPVLKVIAGSDYKAVRPVRVEEPPKGQFGTVTGDQVVCP
ncbi:LCP family protein [Streptomyces sp. AK02-01A]|uniref:LCP family protein n=1 Tax=Streptomyces sp. AK02-01A TaxID=3028648 RepID=UPI0029CA1057|nr:LCP family protein [Streptomyces sp. AK02-01A]